MSTINTVTLSGNLTADPELRQITESFAVCRIRMASSVRRKRGDGYKDVPVYVTAEIYGNDAQFVAQFARKSARIAISGELEYHEWEAKPAQGGGKRSELRVTVDNRNGGKVDLPKTQGASQAPAAPPANGFPPGGFAGPAHQVAAPGAPHAAAPGAPTAAAHQHGFVPPPQHAFAARPAGERAARQHGFVAPPQQSSARTSASLTGTDDIPF